VPGDFDGDTLPDLLATGDHFTNNVVWYHYKPTVAHSKLMQSHPKFLKSQGDTLFIKSHIYNPENHSITVYAIINGIQNTFSDSIQLYDDGQHNDSLASDNIWGNSVWLLGLPKDNYNIIISTHDLIEDYRYSFHTPFPDFTNIGPVVFESFSITGDTLIEPGDNKKFKFTLLNSDNITTATNITSQVVCLDTFASINALVSCQYGDIAAGMTSFSNDGQYIRFSNSCTGGQNISIALNVFSNGHHFWSDTFSIIISGLEKINETVPLSFELKQNYPNPFNPTTTIEFSIPKTEFVTLKVYNIIGQEVATLVSDKLKAGKYNYSWDASDMASGVYIYRFQFGDKIESRKMVLIR